MALDSKAKIPEETKALRLRLIALLSLYDLLPPSLEDSLDADFDALPTLDSAADIESVLHSLNCIAEKLHMADESATAILSSPGVRNALQEPDTMMTSLKPRLIHDSADAHSCRSHRAPGANDRRPHFVRDEESVDLTPARFTVSP